MIVYNRPNQNINHVNDGLMIAPLLDRSWQITVGQQLYVAVKIYNEDTDYKILAARTVQEHTW